LLFNFLAFWPFPWQGDHFENSESSLHIYSLCLTFL
jgi:hypothetical protein